MKKIIVSVSNDISSDQRLNRICSTLQNNGYNVLLIGRKLKNSKNLEQKSYQTKRFKLLFNSGILFYFCLNFRFFLFLLFSKFDCLLSNDLDTLLCNSLISKIKRKKLYYDSHELFTEVPELENKKWKKKIWSIIEKLCIKSAYKSYTVCLPIANFYNQKYGINMKVIRNLPIKKEFLIPYSNRENILIYQGALNLERGIEIMIEAMCFLTDFKLIIAGKGDLENELKQQVLNLNLTTRVIFTGNLHFDELHRYTTSAKLGFSIEQGKSLNYKYALPNKIFDYIQAETPVICADLPEMRKIVENYNVGKVFSGNNPKDLADLILNLCLNQNKLFEYSHNCRKAKTILNWEIEEKKLIEIYC